MEEQRPWADLAEVEGDLNFRYSHMMILKLQLIWTRAFDKVQLARTTGKLPLQFLRLSLYNATSCVRVQFHNQTLSEGRSIEHNFKDWYLQSKFCVFRQKRSFNDVT